KKFSHRKGQEEATGGEEFVQGGKGRYTEVEQGTVSAQLGGALPRNKCSRRRFTRGESRNQEGGYSRKRGRSRECGSLFGPRRDTNCQRDERIPSEEWSESGRVLSSRHETLGDGNPREESSVGCTARGTAEDVPEVWRPGEGAHSTRRRHLGTHHLPQQCGRKGCVLETHFW
ncbi:hypothetical protein PENTCL1PPCAC_19892, partial [Pristionchus entomophagus]